MYSRLYRSFSTGTRRNCKAILKFAVEYGCIGKGAGREEGQYAYSRRIQRVIIRCPLTAMRTRTRQLDSGGSRLTSASFYPITKFSAGEGNEMKISGRFAIIQGTKNGWRLQSYPGDSFRFETFHSRGCQEQGRMRIFALSFRGYCDGERRKIKEGKKKQGEDAKEIWKKGRNRGRRVRRH